MFDVINSEGYCEFIGAAANYNYAKHDLYRALIKTDAPFCRIRRAGALNFKIIAHEIVPMKKLFKKPAMVAGLEKAGKTSFLLALNRIAARKGVKAALFKPFDTGLLEKNAKEERVDGELFAEAMSGEPDINLLSPYIAHEKYPAELAFQRDGIRINWDYIYKCLIILNKRYDKTFVEAPPSLMTPLTEDKFLHEWIKEDAERIIWLIDPNVNDVQRNLAEIHLLKQCGVKFHILLNNVSKVVETNFIFYFWQKIEQLSGRQIEGMLPHISDGKDGDQLAKLASKMESNIPKTLDILINDS